VIEWRYGAQLQWRLVMVGLSEDTSRYASSGYTPARMLQGHLSFRQRYGMPFGTVPKSRPSASSRACRAVVAARQMWPGSEWGVFRALQLANFTTPLLLDDDDQLREVLSTLPGVDADRVVLALDTSEVMTSYQRDKAHTRSAAGSPTELQGKARDSDGAVRYTAPSVIFETEDRGKLEAGGFQPVEAYDVLVANLDPTLERKAPPEDPGELLDAFEFGLTTQEVAALLTHGNDRPDRAAAEVAMVGLLAEGRAERHPLGDDALWTVPDGWQPAVLGSAAAAGAAR
jgi:protein-disulfide isomerase-like protein with CxxC motif